jgi:hypothetical protein
VKKVYLIFRVFQFFDILSIFILLWKKLMLSNAILTDQ